MSGSRQRSPARLARQRSAQACTVTSGPRRPARARSLVLKGALARRRRAGPATDCALHRLGHARGSRTHRLPARRFPGRRSADARPGFRSGHRWKAAFHAGGEPLGARRSPVCGASRRRSTVCRSAWADRIPCRARASGRRTWPDRCRVATRGSAGPLSTGCPCAKRRLWTGERSDRAFDPDGAAAAEAGSARHASRARRWPDGPKGNRGDGNS